MDMEDLSSTLNHGEFVNMLKRRLHYTKLKLIKAQNIRMELLNLLEAVCKEKEETRDMLQKLPNMLLPSTPIQLPHVFPQFHPQSILLLPTNPNSSITESYSLSHISSPVDPFVEAVSWSEFSNSNVIDYDSGSYAYQPWVHNFNCSASPALVSSETPKSDLDPASLVFERLLEGKTLPPKGNLLQSVMEAGPLLQTLLIAGPLPMWRNPPPSQVIKVPPFTLEDFDAPSNPSGPRNNTQQFTSSSNASVNDDVLASKRQRPY